MKIKLLLAAGLVLSRTVAMAQITTEEMFPANGTYILPDSSRIRPDQIDSVSKAWGSLQIRHEKNVFHLSPTTDDDRIKSDANKRELADMLGKQAPDFELSAMNGKHYKLSELKGKVVVLNFWFTSCAPCIQEMPWLNALVSRFAKQDVLFLGIASDNAETIKRFLTHHQFDYTLLPDTKLTYQAYHIKQWPVSMVIDRLGVIQYTGVVSTGYNPSFTDTIEQYLAN